MTAAFRKPNWKPLRAVLPDRIDDFMWMGFDGTIQLYKHRMTRRYLNIDAKTGAFFAFDGKNSYVQVAKDEALRRLFG